MRSPKIKYLIFLSFCCQIIYVLLLRLRTCTPINEWITDMRKCLFFVFFPEAIFRSFVCLLFYIAVGRDIAIYFSAFYQLLTYASLDNDFKFLTWNRFKHIISNIVMSPLQKPNTGLLAWCKNIYIIE